MSATACEPCGDVLPDDTPAGLSTCKQYTDWSAKNAGDTLPADAADDLIVLRELCGLAEALREGQELLRADL